MVPLRFLSLNRWIAVRSRTLCASGSAGSSYRHGAQPCARRPVVQETADNEIVRQECFTDEPESRVEWVKGASELSLGVEDVRIVTRNGFPFTLLL